MNKLFYGADMRKYLKVSSISSPPIVGENDPHYPVHILYKKIWIYALLVLHPLAQVALCIFLALPVPSDHIPFVFVGWTFSLPNHTRYAITTVKCFSNRLIATMLLITMAAPHCLDMVNGSLWWLSNRFAFIHWTT